MSFGGRAFGDLVDYGDLLPGRLRRWLWRGLALLMAFSPSTYIALSTEYANTTVAELLKRIETQLPAPAATPASH